MSVIKEITDGIALVSDAIKNIKEIHTAIKDGKKYFETTHPEIKADVAAMCTELQKTCNAIAVASSVITNFRFNSSPGAIDGEPTRFNNYFISYKNDEKKAEELIRSLKGHCYIIKQHAEKISQGEIKSFWIFLGLKSPEREEELGRLLQKIYDDESDSYTLVNRMAYSLNAAIEDVTNALIVDGMMHASKVKDAALKLSEYSVSFKKLENLAQNTRDELDLTIQELQ